MVNILGKRVDDVGIEHEQVHEIHDRAIATDGRHG
jgi:hypothetical protein